MKVVKKIVAILSLLLVVNSLQAQTSIKPEQAKDHMGDTVQICARVLEGKYLLHAKDAPTRLYMGSRQPTPDITIVINENVRIRMKYDPEKKLVNKQVCVRGRITTYEGRPAIILASPADIEDMQEK